MRLTNMSLKRLRRKLLFFVKLFYLFIIMYCFLLLSKESFKKPQKKVDFNLRTHSRYVKVDPLNVTQELEKEVWRDVLKILWGYGDGGFGIIMDNMTRKCDQDAVLIHGYNGQLSAKIPVKREIRDLRHPSCRAVIYDKELPSAAVVIAFRDQPLSILLRTIWTVISVAESQHHDLPDHNSSCLLPLKEVILVDDCSANSELKGKLAHYIKTRLPPNLVTLLRLSRSLGPLRARLEGARHASADVLVFLEPHSEGQTDWLRPLLQRIKQARTAVAVPQLDRIDAVDFGYIAEDTLMVGGFTFGGDFRWIPVSQHENDRRKTETAPARSPTMKGGTFAINREYFWELGGFEHRTASWGGEDLEMSFRVWQCGGTIEVVPCSRVGIISTEVDRSATWEVTQHINAALTAEVWMDEYKELLYFHWPEYRNHSKVRDVTKRSQLRQNLACNSFQWYLDNVYKDKFIPVRDTVALGRLRNLGLTICLEKRKGAVFGAKCHKAPRIRQFFTLSTDGRLSDEMECVVVRGGLNETKEGKDCLLESVRCDDHNKEKWVYTSSRQLYHVTSGRCLSSALVGLEPAALTPCRPGAPQQKWTFDFYEKDGYGLDGEIISKEKAERLRYIKHQRRSISWDASYSTISFKK